MISASSASNLPWAPRARTVSRVSARQSTAPLSPAAEALANPEAVAGRVAHAAERSRRVQALRSTLDALVGGGVGAAEWVLELGCGHGHFLTAFAGQYPAVQCLGIDLCRDRIRRAERKRQRSALPSLHFIHAEARELLDALPPQVRFRRVFVLFPDPWPKRRHRKHRLVSDDFLDRVAGVSTVGGEFFFRSDALDYVAEVRALVAANARWRLIEGNALPFEEETVFQARAVRFDSLAAVLLN
jgi:tRNA (guanine-N7-)-methyltransferase